MAFPFARAGLVSRRAPFVDYQPNPTTRDDYGKLENSPPRTALLSQPRERIA
jgi:hypothetical protein